MTPVKNASPKLRTASASAKTQKAAGEATVQVGKSKRSERSIRTSGRILDAAEELFSQHGLHGVTIRQIAKDAGVDTALLHYYFGTKNGIFDAVFLRRAKVLNKARMEALDAYEVAAGEQATIEGTIAAFLHPVFEWSRRGGRGWKNYCVLLGQVNNTPAWGGETIAHYFDPVIERLIASLRRLLPQARDEDLYWSYHLLSGALTLTLSETGRIDRLSKNLCHASDLEAIEPRMVQYCAAGFRKVCERP